MENDAENRRRAAGGGYVVRHSFAPDECAALRRDFRGRAEESRTFGRDNCNHSQRPCRARRPKLPSLLQYRTEIKEHSLFHTPPTFAVYVVG